MIVSASECEEVLSAAECVGEGVRELRIGDARIESSLSEGSLFNSRRAAATWDSSACISRPKVKISSIEEPENLVRGSVGTALKSWGIGAAFETVFDRFLVGDSLGDVGET